MLGLKLPGKDGKDGKDKDKGSKRARQGDRGDSEAEAMRALLTQVAKLSLANALSARVMRSIVLDVMHVPASSAVITAIMAATRAFAEAHRPASAQERLGMGMPHHHAWNALIETVKRDAPSGAFECKAIEDYSAFVKTDPVTILTKQVRYVRVTKCYDKTMKKLEVNCYPDCQSYKLWQVIKAFLLKGGCKELPGLAPPGDLERRIQKALDEAAGDGMLED